MQERYARVIFSAAIFLQVLAAIWWASALNSTVMDQRKSLDKSVGLVDTINTKVALLELRTQNLEELSRETRDIVRRLERELKN